MSILKGGESGASLEDIGGSLHKVPHALLQWDTGHHKEKSGLLLVSEHCNMDFPSLLRQAIHLPERRRSDAAPHKLRLKWNHMAAKLAACNAALANAFIINCAQSADTSVDAKQATHSQQYITDNDESAPDQQCRSSNPLDRRLSP